MATEVKDSRPIIRCRKCGNVAFVNLKGWLIHLNTETRACPEILPSGLQKPAA